MELVTLSIHIDLKHEEHKPKKIKSKSNLHNLIAKAHFLLILYLLLANPLSTNFIFVSLFFLLGQSLASFCQTKRSKTLFSSLSWKFLLNRNFHWFAHMNFLWFGLCLELWIGVLFDLGGSKLSRVSIDQIKCLPKHQTKKKKSREANFHHNGLKTHHHGLIQLNQMWKPKHQTKKKKRKKKKEKQTSHHQSLIRCKKCEIPCYYQ